MMPKSNRSGTKGPGSSRRKQRLMAAALLLLAAAACSGAHKAGGGAAPAAKCKPAEGLAELSPQSFHGFFESQQAAYYVAEGDNLLLAVRVKEEMDTAEVLGKLLALVATKFDFRCEKRKQIILVSYKGFIEEKRNIGMLVDVTDLRLLQGEVIDIDELSERARYIEGLDLGSIKSLIVK
jgi:hypothetical protein